MLSVTGEPGKMPMRPGVQTADVFGALFATYATLAGLVGAGRTGEGFVADVSLVETAIAAAAWEAADYLETGKVPQPLGNRHRLNAPYQLFEMQGRALSRHRHAQRSAVQPASCRCSGWKRMSAIRALSPMPAARPTKTRCWRWSSRRCARAIRQEIEAALMEAGVPCALRQQFQGGVRRSADHRARRGEGYRASAARDDARGAQSDSARPRRPDHRAALRRCWASIPRKSCASSAIRPRRSRQFLASGVTRNAQAESRPCRRAE